MQKFFRRFLVCLLAAVTLFTNVNVYGARTMTGTSDFYQTRKYGQESVLKNTAVEETSAQIQKGVVMSVTEGGDSESEAGDSVSEDGTSQKTETGAKTDSGQSEESAGDVGEDAEDAGNTAQDVGTTEDTESGAAPDADENTGTDEKSDTERESVKNEGTEEDTSAKTGTNEGNTEAASQREDAAEETGTATAAEGTEEEDESQLSAFVLRSTNPRTNHDVTMPDVTSHYFLLQKNSKKVSAASGANLKVVSDAKAASQYIYETYTNGKQYNFTPRFTSKTKVTVSGGDGGGVALSTVKKGSYDKYGDVYNAVQNGVIQTKVYNLNKCSVNPSACYTNVGTWYDYNSGRTYSVDMKMTVTGYKFPGATTRKQLANQDLTAPYVGFRNNIIGIVVMGTDYVQTRLDFYYSGTQTAVSGLCGVVQFCDVDAQQGVDFGKGFEKIVMFKTANSKLQYNKTGLTSGSLGYVSSRVNEDLDKNDANTTVLGLFSGSSVNCRWTVAKCDQEDTGGDAAYAVKEGYGIPAESSQADSISYYWSNSTGLLVLRADVGLAPMPDNIQKSIYSGAIDGTKSDSGEKFLNLSDRDDIFTYVLCSAAATPSNIKKAKYTSFVFSDTVDSALEVKNVQIYADEAVSDNVQSTEVNYTNATSSFTVTKEEDDSHRTVVTATAKTAKLSDEDFYGRTYYIHIEVQVKSDEALHKIGKSIQDWYQEDESIAGKVTGTGTCRGTVMVDNQGSISVANNQGSSVTKSSNYVASRIPMILKVKKVDEHSGKPIEGVVFGLFGGEDIGDPAKASPLYTAVTDEEGIAVFQSDKTLTFYKEAYGDGAYCVKEISVPEKYQNVWRTSVSRKWVYKIDTLKTEALFQSKETSEPAQAATLTNKNQETDERVVKVYKKSKDTGAFLSGAQFMLSQWSETSGEYEELFLLEEGTEEEGKPVYQNTQKIVNTMDNLGKYKISEQKAPNGCVLTGQEWAFELSDAAAEDGSNIVYENTASGKKQTGALVYSNPLQKSRLSILKTDDEGNAVSGAVFSVTAAEDIYAPWDVDDAGKPVADAEPLVSKGTVVDKIKTKEDGRGESTKGAELYIGKYTVKETGAALNHIKGEGVCEADLTYGTNQEIAVLTYTLDAGNSLMKPSFAVSKLADKTTDETGESVNYDEEKGRYTEKKYAGTYAAKGIVDYTIRVTNTGNVRLYNIELTDDMDREGETYKQSLSQYADMETAAFTLPESGSYKTSKGDQVKGTLSNDSNLVLILSHLDVGDSVEVHLTVQLKEDAKDAWQLENDVYGAAQYNDNGEDSEEDSFHLSQVSTENLLDEEGNSLVMDKDFINVPGKPDENVVKKADRTTGVAIDDGEIQSGVKVPGVYQTGEQVVFSIFVKNTGEAALKNITVKDIMSEELKQVVEEESAGFVFSEENQEESGLLWLTTAQEKKISVRQAGKDELVLCTTGEDGDGTDRLFAGDYIELKYAATVRDGMANLYALSNKVSINGWYFDGEKDRKVPEEEDEDEVDVPGIPEGRTAKLADKTTGVTLKEGRYDAQAKISGVYENGETVTYKITVTNSGTANLYGLELRDEMSSELAAALNTDSVSFVKKTYTSKAGRKVRTVLVEKECLQMDFLAAGDAVDVYLTGKVRDDVGNLFALKNTVTLTANYKKGNEDAQKKYEEQMEKDKQVWKLTYDANHDSGETATDSETPCRAGTEISVNGNGFVYEGHVFIGWNTKADGSGEAVSPDAAFAMPEGNVTLYAQWSEESTADGKIPVYCLIYDSNNQYEQTEADEENAKPAESVLSVNKNCFVNPGRQFTGWNTKKNGTGTAYLPGDSIILPEKDITLYAQWGKVPVYTLVYDANNGSGQQNRDAQTPCEAGVKIQIDGNRYSYADSKKIWKFTEWNTRPDGQGVSYKPGETKEINADVTLYAQWAEDTDENPEEEYHLFYYANNKTADLAADANTPAKAGTEIALEENTFFYRNYRFLCWNTRADGSGKSYMPGDTFTMKEKDTYLYAIWEKTTQVTLIYDSNTADGSSGSASGAEQITDAETPAAPETQITVDGNAFTNEGYNFTGWNTRADGSGKSYSPAETLTLQEDTVLYAQWTRNTKKYRLTYYSNYPEGSSADETGDGDADETEEADDKETDSETPCYGGTKIKLNANYFRCQGYMFAGWITTRDGKTESGTQTAGEFYQPGDKYRMPEKDVVLYAQWEKASDDSSTDSDSDGKDGSADSDSDNEDNGTDSDSDSGDSSGDSSTDSDSGSEDNSGDQGNAVTTAEETQKAIEEAYEAIQKLALEDAMEQAEEYEAIPVTELMKDDDKINVPGTPVVKTAKLADKTTGVTFENGRYHGTKKEGIYESGDALDYTITVTNSGTADLYELIVEDTLDDALLAVVNPDSVSLADGTFATKNGNEVQAERVKSKEQTGKLVLSLDKLSAGDSVELHLTGTIKSEAEQATGLNNTVKVTARYETVGTDGEREKEDVPETPEMTDNDRIGVGTPELKVAKAADKTSGITLKKGRYSGERQYGTYTAGETVTFTITVSNKGNGDAYHVKVKEKPSAALKKYLNINGFTCKKGENLRTKNGEKAKVESVGQTEVKLDRIAAGDTLELTYTAKVKKDISSVKALKNRVLVTGERNDGSSVLETSDMKDYDKINLKADRKTSTSSPKTGDDTNMWQYAVLLAGAFLCAVFILLSRRKKKNKSALKKDWLKTRLK